MVREMPSQVDGPVCDLPMALPDKSWDVLVWLICMNNEA